MKINLTQNGHGQPVIILVGEEKMFEHYINNLI